MRPGTPRPNPMALPLVWATGIGGPVATTEPCFMLWPAERVVVEVDGFAHHAALLVALTKTLAS